jgi:uncharacterized protein (DUF2336 family)
MWVQPMTGNMAFLNHSDVQRLMAQPSPHVRAVVANKIARYMDTPLLTETELQIAHDIIRTMANDVEMVVRRSVAHSLRYSKHLPHDIAVRLANDVEAVSLPILTDSVVLTDDDLIEILQNSSTLKQKAIAARPYVSERVSHVVIEHASENVVATLMNNKTSTISDNALLEAIDRFGYSEAVKEGMVRREKLPVMVAERLVVLVSEKLQEYLVARHTISPHLADEIMAQSRERSVIQLSRDQTFGDIENLVGHMHKNARLTPTLILRAICVGNLPFFEFALAVMANIPLVNARALIHDVGSDGLRTLCQETHMPLQFLPVIRAALGVLEQNKLAGTETDFEDFRARLIERLLTGKETLGEKDMEYLLELLK